MISGSSLPNLGWLSTTEVAHDQGLFMLNSHRTRLTTAMVGLLLAVPMFVLSACGESTPAGGETTAVESVGPEAETESTGESESAVQTDAEDGQASTPTGGVLLTDGAQPPERTITFTDGAYAPSTLTIKVGEKVTFVAGDDKISAVIVADLDGATVTKGLTETFVFSKPGVYPVKEDLTGATATITVE
jgi:plastocyanin